MTQGALFRCGGTGLLRAPVLPVDTPAVLADRADDSDAAGTGGVAVDDTEAAARTVRRVAADPLVREAVETASPSLGAVVRQLTAGTRADDPPTPKEVRRAARALTSYLLRMSARATPFGLMAGVAAVEYAGDATVRARLGHRHRRRVRPDRGWLAGLVAGIQGRPGVLAHLRLVASDQCRERDGRLVVPAAPRQAAGTASDPASEVTLRHTIAVRAALDLAATPTRGADLARRLRRRLPGASSSAIESLIGQLVERGVLLTEAQPSPEVTDPLAAVCAVLAELPCPAAVLPEREALRELRTALEACEAAPLGAGRRSLAAARDRIARLGPGERALQTDLALDADVRLPRRVSEDAERAAHLLWRLAPRQEGSAPLRAYHAAFLSRYGTDRLVPLAELIDPDVGLGTLEHHRASPGHGDTGADDLTPAVPTPAVPTPAVPKAAASPPSGTTTNGPGDRDGLLAALAQEALLDGTPEVLLTDDHPLVAALASDDGTPPPSLDLCGQLLAETPDDLASGDFRLVLTGAAPQATAMSGRFAGLLHAGHREQLAAVARSSATAVPGGADAAVQLTGPAGRSRAANIAHAPRLLPRVLSVGAFTDRTGITDSTTAVRGGGLAVPVRDGAAQTPLSVAGLVVGADRRRLWLREAATGRVVTPAAFHVLHPESPELPPVARFLRELAGSGVRSWQPWDWGGAVALPWLPRVRYGTTVLAPARWLPTEELRDQRASFDAWSETLRRWRERWRVPDRVRVGHGDRRIELSCDQPEQARVLRHELGRDRRSVIQEAPTVAGCPDGWLRGHGGRAHRAEVVLPLVCTAAAPTVPPPPPGRPYQAGRPDAATGDGAGVEAPPDAGQRPGPQQLPGSQRRYGPPQGDRPQQEASPPQGAGPAPPYGADRAERAAPPRVHLPGGSWLSAVLYCRPERQDDILVGHLPYLLERLPPTVDRWFYVRYRDALGPHLRLRFHTADPEETNARVLPLVREFTETVLNAGIGQSLTLDTYRPEIERYGGPDALTAAERVFHADSLAALAQLSPLRDGRAALDPAVLSAAHQAACARAFHTGMTRDGDGGDAGRAPGDPSPSPGGSPSPGALPAPASGARAAGTAASRTAGTDPATGTGALAGAGSAEKSDGAMDGWWPLPAVRNPEADRLVRGHRDTVRDLTDPSRPVGQAPLVTLGLPPGPAADRLNVCWERRAEALIALGRTLRGLGPHATATPENVVSSVLHMLHNRLVGPDRDGERRAHALVSGGLRAHRGRTRHGPGASPRSRPEVAGRAR